MTATLAAPRARRRYPGELFLALRRDPLGTLERLQREHGDVVELRFGPQAVFLFSHPDAVHEILVTEAASFVKGLGLQRARVLLGDGLLTSEGEVHQRGRRLMQPVFTPAAVAGFAPDMAAFARRQAERLPDGASVDLHQEMMRLALAVVAKTLFGVDIESSAADIGRALEDVLGMSRYLMLPFATTLLRLPLPANRRFHRARARLDAAIQAILQARRARAGAAPDLLQRLLEASDEPGEAAALDDRALRDEAMTLLLAGHETTANALTWTWLLLARHPEVEARLHAEVDSVLGDRLPGREDVARLDYTSRVLLESMRLYPPAWILGRRALREVAIQGYRVPARALCLTSQWLVHHDARFWPEPLRFDPDRFLPAAREARPRQAYFPFGDGPRRCIGEAFALLEGTLLMATLARRIRARLEREEDVRPLPTITLRPRDGLRMRIEQRRPRSGRSARS